MSLSPQEADKLLDTVTDLVQEAKAVRRRASVVVQIGARLEEKLRHHLQTEEVTREDERNRDN